jgi:hypothetical protein
MALCCLGTEFEFCPHGAAAPAWQQEGVAHHLLAYSWRRASIGVAMSKTVAATPMPSSQVLGGTVAT